MARKMRCLQIRRSTAAIQYPSAYSTEEAQVRRVKVSAPSVGGREGSASTPAINPLNRWYDCLIHAVMIATDLQPTTTGHDVAPRPRSASCAAARCLQ